MIVSMQIKSCSFYKWCKDSFCVTDSNIKESVCRSRIEYFSTIQYTGHFIYGFKAAVIFCWSLNPTYDQAMNNLGNIYKDKQNFPEAHRLLSSAVLVRYHVWRLVFSCSCLLLCYVIVCQWVHLGGGRIEALDKPHRNTPIISFTYLTYWMYCKSA